MRFSTKIEEPKKTKKGEEVEEKPKLDLSDIDKAVLEVCKTSRHISAILPKVRLYLRKEGSTTFLVTTNSIVESLKKLKKLGLIEEKK